jgi:hypothetical protein
MFSVTMASASSAASICESTKIAILGPTPETEISLTKRFFSSGEIKPNSEMPSSFTCK